jgi:hypothetical protein
MLDERPGRALDFGFLLSRQLWRFDVLSIRLKDFGGVNAKQPSGQTNSGTESLGKFLPLPNNSFGVISD